MSGKKAFLYLFLIFAVSLLIGRFLDSSKPANYLNTAECQELDRQMEALIVHRRTITKHDIRDKLRDDKQNNQYGALIQRMKEQGCLYQSPN